MAFNYQARLAWQGPFRIAVPDLRRYRLRHSAKCGKSVKTVGFRQASPTLHPLAASGTIAADGVIATGHHLGGDDVFHDTTSCLRCFCTSPSMVKSSIPPIIRSRQCRYCEYSPRSGKQLRAHIHHAIFFIGDCPYYLKIKKASNLLAGCLPAYCHAMRCRVYAIWHLPRQLIGMHIIASAAICR